MRDLISETLTTKMLSLVDDLATVFQHIGSSTIVNHYGSVNSSNRYQNVALDFVKFTTHVLSVDFATVNEIGTLKRILLSQVILVF